MNGAGPMETQPEPSSSAASSEHRHPDVTGRYYVPGFPIGEGKTDYEKYLRTIELLSLQTPSAQAVSHEELLFQVTHQASELWMKLMLDELERAIAHAGFDVASGLNCPAHQHCGIRKDSHRVGAG
ncbi:MAG: Tryptophan 2,3-dioxygenase [Vampirovibrio sp.]|nr:Tryptophan 2,3-dioxygenase [Vampirovibrio sp.]